MYGGKFALGVCGGGLIFGGAYFLNFSVFDFTSIRSTWRACTQSENR